MEIRELKHVKYIGRQLDKVSLPFDPCIIVIYSGPQRIGDIIINSGMYLSLRKRFPNAEIIQYEPDIYPTSSLWKTHPALVKRITFKDICFKPNADKTWKSLNNTSIDLATRALIVKPDLLIDLVRKLVCSVSTSYRLLPRYRYSMLPRFPFINGYSIGIEDFRRNIGLCNMWELSQALVYPLTQSYIEPTINWGITGFSERVNNWLALKSLQIEVYAVLCPTAGHPSKLWFNQGWIDVIHYLIKNSIHPVIIVPQSEMKSIRSTYDEIQGVTFFPGDDSDLNDPLASLELMKHAKLTIGVDSGGVHLAAAAGCPVIVLTHPRNFIQWLPIAKVGRAIVSNVEQLSNEHSSWLEGINSEIVCEAIEHLL